MDQPSRKNFASRCLKSLRKTLSPDVGGLAASSELRFQDALLDQRSRRAAKNTKAHGSPRRCKVATSHASRALIGF